MRNNEIAIAKAFTMASVTAAQILRFAVENPAKVAKSEEPAVQAEVIKHLSFALARQVARATLGPVDYADYMERKFEWLERYEAWQSARPAATIHKSECECDGCVREGLHDLAAEQVRTEKAEWIAKRQEITTKHEAKQATIKAEHTRCDHAPCDVCKIAREEDEMYSKAVDNTRPHLDADRAERDGDMQSVPWREDEDGDPVEKTSWQQTPTYKAAVEIGFRPGDTDDALVHSNLGHVMKFAEDGSWLITNGWDGSTTYKGTTPDDLVEAMEVLDQ